MIPVAANDVAFSIHAVALTAITLFQVLIYERGNQTLSKAAKAITSITWVSALICLAIAWEKWNWLWLITVFNTIQIIMTAIKYIPQAFMNFKRKSTVGWSIGNILLDLTGAIFNFMQMGVQSINQHTFVNFYGNVGKTLLSLEVIFFDILFIVQHYVLYRPVALFIPTTCHDAAKPAEPSHSPSGLPLQTPLMSWTMECYELAWKLDQLSSCFCKWRMPTFSQEREGS